MLIEREGSRVRSMSLWESEAGFQTSAAWNQEQVAKFASLFAAPTVAEKFELVAEVIRHKGAR